MKAKQLAEAEAAAAKQALEERQRKEEIEEAERIKKAKIEGETASKTGAPILPPSASVQQPALVQPPPLSRSDKIKSRLAGRM